MKMRLAKVSAWYNGRLWIGKCPMCAHFIGQCVRFFFICPATTSRSSEHWSACSVFIHTFRLIVGIYLFLTNTHIQTQSIPNPIWFGRPKAPHQDRNEGKLNVESNKKIFFLAVFGFVPNRSHLMYIILESHDLHGPTGSVWMKSWLWRTRLTVLLPSFWLSLSLSFPLVRSHSPYSQRLRSLFSMDKNPM